MAVQTFVDNLQENWSKEPNIRQKIAAMIEGGGLIP